MRLVMAGMALSVAAPATAQDVQPDGPDIVVTAGKPLKLDAKVLRAGQRRFADLLGPIVLERVNTHLGWRAVGKLVIKQGPVAAPPPPARPAPLASSEREAIAQKVAVVEDPGLRDALLRLGCSVKRKARNGS